MYINEIGAVVFVVIENGELYVENYLSEYVDLEFSNEITMEDNYEYCQNK